MKIKFYCNFKPRVMAYRYDEQRKETILGQKEYFECNI